MNPPFYRSYLQILLLFLLLFLPACQSAPLTSTRTPFQITIQHDNTVTTLATTATTVREALQEANITLNPADEVDPPLFTPLTADTIINLIRITESIEVIEQGIPFDRQVVRNEAMSATDAPIIVQPGKTGLQERTVRIVYRNGLEVERVTTQAITIEEPQNEIIMVGFGATPGNQNFPGRLAYINDGQAVLLRGSNAFPEQLNTGPSLDRRVFSLSPTGDYLLYTRATSSTTTFNQLWLVATTAGAAPQSLGINNVLWADWNPATTSPVIAYTTGLATELLPGWEANNDLWLGTLATTSPLTITTQQLIESYPATYGWWGGSYAWAPNGRSLAYSYADEIGLISLPTQPTTSDEDTDDAPTSLPRTILQRFTEYNTRSDWVWVPTLSWSADSRFLLASQHVGDDPTALNFDTWVFATDSNLALPLAPQTGIWSHAQWAPTLSPPIANGHIVYLRATNPLDSLRTTYTLWLMDRDGSNSRQLYPPVGENSRFPREQQFMAWGPDGDQLAFIFNEDLYLHNLPTNETFRLTRDDSITSHPTWAPYGAAR
ncbi:MAG TPA: G5 domain-containing protein [Anaerolineae bacterium]|nr:G5 domain-containing protein [Anaerolineae bacterium]